MATVSDTSPEPAPLRLIGVGSGAGHRTGTLRRVLYALAAALGAVAIAAVAVGVVALRAKPALSPGSLALASVKLPFGSGTIERVTVIGGLTQSLIPVRVSGDSIWPRGLLATHEGVTVVVVVKRPSWISWLAGDTQRLTLTVMTPSVRLRSHYLTVAKGQPLRLAFNQPVRVFESGFGPHLRHRVLAAPQRVISLPESAPSGTVFVAAAPRAWELPRPSAVDWFPAGARGAAVAYPAPGGTIGPNTPISLNFYRPVSQVLGSHMPPVSPATQGTWHQVNAHEIVFRPQGYGYGLGATVTVGLPSNVQLVGERVAGSDPSISWTVPDGSILRLQQLLAQLGYLPFNFTTAGAPVANTLSAQETAAAYPPRGTFSWRYPNIPAGLRALWQPGAAGVVTRGAIMAFENDHGLTPDGAAGPQVWKAMFAEVLAGHSSSFGYTFVTVHEGSTGEHLELWHNGRNVLTPAVNTGIPAAPTATGTYPVFEHLTSTTMSGTNPDGSHYSDPGVPWVSYFNGGDALHGFLRPGYGYPQSLGCVEMSYADAAKVWPFTPIGTLVDVTPS